MAKVLVKFSDEYNDEFTCQEFTVFDSQEDLDNLISKYDNRIQTNGVAKVYFGTNEFLEYYSVDQFLNTLNVFEITDQEAEVFKKFFGQTSFGTGCVFNAE